MSTIILFTSILLVFEAIISQHTSLAASNNINFNKKYLGVLFEPYTKFHEDRYDYSMEEVESMLKILSTRFQRFSTFGMGTLSPSTKWQFGHAVGFSPVAAAHINKQNGKLALTVNIGTANFANEGQLFQEMKNAFEAADEANKIYNETVKGILMGEDTGEESKRRRIIANLKLRRNETSLKLGIRSSACENIDIKSPTALELLEQIDFIICHKNPISFRNVTRQVDFLGNYFLQIQSNLKNVEIIGQTIWPSWDFVGKKFYAKDSVQFWIEMGKWAEKNKFLVDILSAFDEPWKAQGIKGGLGLAEGHCGWWKRVKNDTSDATAFVEKIEYVENIPTENHTIEIIFGILGATVFIFMLTGIIILYKRLIIVKNQLLSQADITAFRKGLSVTSGQVEETTEEALRLPYDKSYEIPKAKLLIDKSSLLGSGAFGCVYKGKVTGVREEVALKTTIENNSSATSLKSLLSEIKILIHVGKHPNVVGIIGAYTEEIRKGVIIIAIELCTGGSLEKYLRIQKTSLETGYENVSSTISSVEASLLKDMLRWSYEIACGMDHIASKKIIHADLATRNVLLSVDGKAKITDFGLSRRMYEYTNYIKQNNQEPLPWRWMAIEALQGMTFSTKSDVWSYGVCLWEIFSLGSQPFPGLGWTVDFAEDLVKGLRMKKPTYATEEIYSIMYNCWKHFPKDRPNFSNLASLFDGLLYRSNSMVIRFFEHEIN